MLIAPNHATAGTANPLCSADAGLSCENRAPELAGRSCSTSHLRSGALFHLCLERNNPRAICSEHLCSGWLPNQSSVPPGSTHPSVTQFQRQKAAGGSIPASHLQTSSLGCTDAAATSRNSQGDLKGTSPGPRSLLAHGRRFTHSTAVLQTPPASPTQRSRAASGAGAATSQGQSQCWCCCTATVLPERQSLAKHGPSSSPGWSGASGWFCTHRDKSVLKTIRADFPSCAKPPCLITILGCGGEWFAGYIRAIYVHALAASTQKAFPAGILNKSNYLSLNVKEHVTKCPCVSCTVTHTTHHNKYMLLSEACLSPPALPA